MPLSPQAERPPIRPLTTGEVQALLDGREDALADLRDDMTANFARGPGRSCCAGWSLICWTKPVLRPLLPA
jgi:hypothetical protein